MSTKDAIIHCGKLAYQAGISSHQNPFSAKQYKKYWYMGWELAKHQFDEEEYNQNIFETENTIDEK